MIDKGSVFMFTVPQLAILLRGTIGMANEFYSNGETDDEKVYRQAIAQEFIGLQAERALVDRKEIPEAEFQIYPLPISYELQSDNLRNNRN